VWLVLGMAVMRDLPIAAVARRYLIGIGTSAGPVASPPGSNISAG
jgi:hypothetical protein